MSKEKKENNKKKKKKVKNIGAKIAAIFMLILMVLSLFGSLFLI